MRMASFAMNRDGDAGACTIISLSGAAGGLEANIQRWIRQLELPELGADELQAFIAKQTTVTTDGGLSVLIVDLRTLNNATGDTPSIIAGVVELDQSTLFVKFNASARLLEAEKTEFLSLCQSLSREPAK